MKEYYTIFSVMSAPNPIYVPDDETKKWAETCLEEEPDEPYTEEELAAARQFQEDIQNSLGIRVFIRKSDDDNTDPSTPSSSSAKSENF